MNEKKTAQSFAQDIRKIGMKHVMVPIFVVVVAVVVLVSLISYASVRYSASRLSETVSESLTTLLVAYMEQLTEITADTRMEAILFDTCDGISLAEDLYRFINAQAVGGHFFIFDTNGKNILSSTRILSNVPHAEDPFAQGTMRSLLYQNDALRMKINHIGSARSSSLVLSIEQDIIREGVVLGTLVFELSPTEILEYISTSQPMGGDIVVTNSYQTSLLSSRSTYIDQYSKLRPEFRTEKGTVNADGKQYYILGNYSDATDLWVYIFVEYGSLSQMLGITYIVVAILFSLAILAISLAANRIVTAQAGSIDDLHEQLTRMKVENTYRPLEPINSDFESLETSYNELIASIQELIAAREEEARLRQEAEIKQLGSHFNAHFIFNTLEVIRISMQEDVAAANQLVLDFSRLLRYSIDSAKDLVPLIDDIQYIESYLSMHAIRLDDFSYAIHLAEATEEIIIPKLSLQPLVENSLQHPHPERPLRIEVDATVADEVLVVRVKDTGSGIDEATLVAIQQVLEETKVPSKFYGLYNVHRRLRLGFGAQAGIAVQSGSWGTVVTMRLPTEYGDD